MFNLNEKKTIPFYEKNNFYREIFKIKNRKL